ncbi:hypothetical protein DERF_012406 [Dermatophagoides farinae]|uniref:Endonuclease/exonuclease/phosphatase domain-containing protein n=1 Tax=Dermatophagoides farinae TaxID=6954 RepID=A0A922HPZ7_DERFA|nr:hypothetical protein DERF_012406 [Dermatophagoides farinae]
MDELAISNCLNTEWMARINRSLSSPKISIDSSTIMVNLIKDLLLVENLISTYSSYPIIVTGVFNSHHQTWGNGFNDERGRLIMDFICQMNLTLLNDGSTTFDNFRHESAIDLTIINQHALNFVSNWKTEDLISGSDHHLISFYYGSTISIYPKSLTRKYYTKNIDWSSFIHMASIKLSVFTNSVDDLSSCDQIDKFVNDFISSIQQICDISLPLLKHGQKTKNYQTKCWPVKNIVDITLYLNKI